MKSTIEFIPSCMHTEHFHHHHPLRSFEKVLKTLISQMYEKKWIICSTFFGEELLTVTTGSKIHPFSIRIRHQRLYQVSKWIFVALFTLSKKLRLLRILFLAYFFFFFPCCKVYKSLLQLLLYKHSALVDWTLFLGDFSFTVDVRQLHTKDIL